MLKLRRWIESYLGVEPAAAGEDTQWRLRWHLDWPDWVLFLFVLAAVAVVVGVYLREGTRAPRKTRLSLAGIRLALVALLLLMLGGLEIAVDRTGLPYLVFLVDDSESMQVKDRLDGDTSRSLSAPPLADPSRLQRVVEWLQRDEGRPFESLTLRHKIQVHAQSSTPRLLGSAVSVEEARDLLAKVKELEPTGSQSRIGANLRTVLNNLRGIPPSAVVLLSDGVTTEGEPLPQAAQYAARKNIPLFTVGVGDPSGVRDLELHDLMVDGTVFVDDLVSFDARLTGRGLEGERVKVRLLEAGRPQPLDEKTFVVAADGKPQKVRLDHRPTAPGTVDYVLEVVPVDRELQKENNKIERQVVVLKEKIRVLYVESYPRYEFRFLKSLLERESTIELSVLLLDADPEYIQQDRAAIGFFPAGKKELFEYDVLIFGDVSPAVFSPAQLELVREFVRSKGGGFLVIAGEQFAPAGYRDTALADLLPVEVGARSARDGQAPSAAGFSPRLTVDGRASPIFRFAGSDEENEQVWKTLPPLYWFARTEKAKPGAVVLAEHPAENRSGQPLPLVATQFFGAGRTYFQAFDSSWRWRYRAEDRFHARYWIQTIRYLSRSKLLGKNRAVEVLVDRQRYRRGDPVHLRVRFLDESLAPAGEDGVTVALEHERHGSRTATLRALPGQAAVFEGIFGEARDGRYRVRLTSPAVAGSVGTADFSVVPPPGELERVAMNESEMRQAAQLTGGKFYTLAEADRLFDDLPSGRRVALHTEPPIPLWNTWPMLAVFASLLVLEWVVRKVYSLI